MSLKKYWQKRKFEKTSEPKGEIFETSKDRFVVQEHWAKTHHFDFRLEMFSSAKTTEEKEVVLKSWAVPKGVPEKEGIKRLAIQTEDHPCSYIDFEGEIPEGSYGAGTVKIFDKGEYKLKERTEDKIIFELKGEKLKGNYILIKTKSRENQWLLFKTS